MVPGNWTDLASAVVLEELTDAFWRISDNDSVVAVVLTGAGNSFSAGVDLKWLQGQKGRSEASVQDALKDAQKRLKTMQVKGA